MSAHRHILNPRGGRRTICIYQRLILIEVALCMEAEARVRAWRCHIVEEALGHGHRRLRYILKQHLRISRIHILLDEVVFVVH